MTSPLDVEIPLDDPTNPQGRFDAGARRLAADIAREREKEARRDPVSEQITALTKWKSDLGRMGQAQDLDEERFLAGEGAGLFVRDEKGKPYKNPDGSYVPEMGAKIEGLRARAGSRVGVIRGALTPGIAAGDMTSDAKAAQAELDELEPQYTAINQKWSRLQERRSRLKAAQDETEANLGALAEQRLQRSGLMLGTPAQQQPIAAPVSGTLAPSLKTGAPVPAQPKQDSGFTPPSREKPYVADNKGPSVGQYITEGTKNFVANAGDVGLGLASGVSGLLKMVGDVYGLATGDMDNWASNTGRAGSEFFQSAESEDQKARRAEVRAMVDAAPDEIGKALAYVKGTITNPMLAASTLAEQAPNLIGSGGVGALVRKGAEKILLRKAASEAAMKLAAKKAAALGVGAAVGTGASMQGGDVGGDAYLESLVGLEQMTKPQLMQIPEIAQLVSRDATIEEAKLAYALTLARKTGAVAGGISLAANNLPGGRTIEKALVGGAARGAGSRVAGAVTGALGEAFTEALEEGGGQIAKNAFARGFDPTRDLTEGVGEAVGQAVLTSGVMGGIAGASRGSVEPGNPRGLREFKQPIPLDGGGSAQAPVATPATEAPATQPTPPAQQPVETEVTPIDDELRAELEAQAEADQQPATQPVQQQPAATPTPQTPVAPTQEPDPSLAGNASNPRSGVEAPGPVPAPTPSTQGEPDAQESLIRTSSPGSTPGPAPIPEPAAPNSIAQGEPSSPMAEEETRGEAPVPSSSGSADVVSIEPDAPDWRQRHPEESKAWAESPASALREDKRAEIANAASWGDAEYQYTVFDGQPGRPRALQIDIIRNGDNITSTNLDDLERAAGVALPVPPADMPPGQYTQAQIEEALQRGQRGYEKSSTQVTLPPEKAAPVREFADSIPESDIYTEEGDRSFGRETEPHITALYGIENDDVEPVRQALANVPPIKVMLDEVSAFENDDRPYDVLKVGVNSPALRAVNAAIKKATKNSSDFPDYKPHLTIAYLKKGMAKKYVGDDRFKGETLSFDTLQFRTRDGRSIDIPLKGNPSVSPETPEGKVGGSPTPASSTTVPGQGAGFMRQARIPKGKNTPLELSRAIHNTVGLQDGTKESEFIQQFSKRLQKMNPTAFKDMEVQVLNGPEWIEAMSARSSSPRGAAAYEPGRNILWLNKEKLTPDSISDVFVHESGHFAEKFALGEAFTQGEWESLTDAQREAAAREYDPKDTRTGSDLRSDKGARAEWVAFQFSRVVRGDTKNMSQRMATKLKQWLEVVRDVVRRFRGNEDLTTEALDKKILDALGYAPDVSADVAHASETALAGQDYEYRLAQEGGKWTGQVRSVAKDGSRSKWESGIGVGQHSTRASAANRFAARYPNAAKTSSDPEIKAAYERQEAAQQKIRDAEAAERAEREKVKARNAAYLAEVDAIPLPKGAREIITTKRVDGSTSGEKAEATVYGDFAVHRGKDARGDPLGWVVTHVPSGLAARKPETRAKAQQLVKAIIHSGVDTSSPDLRKDNEKLRRIGGAVNAVENGTAPNWYESGSPPVTPDKPAEAPKPVAQDKPIESAKPAIQQMRFKEIRNDLLRQIADAIEKAPNREQFRGAEVRKLIEEKGYRAPTNAEGRWKEQEKLQERINAASGSVTIKSGNSTFTVPNNKESLEGLKKKISGNIGSATNPLRGVSTGQPDQVKVREGFANAKTEAERRGYMDMMSETTLKALKLDKDYTRLAPGVVMTKEAAEALRGLRAGQSGFEVLGAPDESKPGKPAPVPDRPGMFYRSEPDSLREAGVGVMRQIYERRPHAKVQELALAVIETVGEEKARQIAIDKNDNGVPGDVKTMVYGELIARQAKILADPKSTGADRAKAQRTLQQLDNEKAPQFTERGQEISALQQVYKNAAAGGIAQYLHQKKLDRDRALGGDQAKKDLEEASGVLNAENEKAIDRATKEMTDALRKRPISKSVWTKYREWAADQIYDWVDGIQNPPPELAALDSFTRDIVSEIRSRIQAELGEAGKTITREEKNPSDLLRDAILNKEKFGDVFKTVRERLVKEFGEDSDIVEKADMVLAHIGAKPYSKRILDKVIKQAHEAMGTNVRELAKLHYTNTNRIHRDLADALSQIAGLSESTSKELADDLDKRMQELTAEGKKRALLSLVKKHSSTPNTKKIMTAIERAVLLNNYGALNVPELADIVAKELKLPHIDPEQMQEIAKIGDRIETATTMADKARGEMDMLRALRIAKGISRMDVATSVWYANLLSGYTTQGANTFGNMVNGTAQLATMMATNPKYAGEALRGWISGFSEGWAQGAAIMKTGRGSREFDANKTGDAGNILELVDFKRDFPDMNEAWAKARQNHVKALRYVTRMMKAVDSVFYYPAREAHARVAVAKLLEGQYQGQELRAKIRETLAISPDQFAAARKRAEAEGFTGIDLTLRVSNIIEEARRATTEGTAAADASEQFALETTFNNEPEGWAGVLYQQLVPLTQSIKPGGVPVLRVFLPFLRVPTNVFNASMNYTPVGSLRAFRGVPTKAVRGKDGQFDIERRQFTSDERKRLHAQTIGGSLAMATLAALALSPGDDEEERWFDITATGPDDYTKRQQLEATGWRPHSIKMGDTWVAYKDSPMLIPLAVTGHVVDAVRYGKQSDELALSSKVFNALMTAPRAIMDTSMLSGLGQLMEYASGKATAKQLVNFLSRTGTSLVVPNALQQIDRQFSPEAREANGPLGTVGASLPFVRRTGDVKTDVLGEPVERSPLARFGSSESNDPVREVLRDKGIFISTPSRSTKLLDGPMDEDTYRQYVRMSGERIKARLLPNVQILRSQTKENAERIVDRITREERERAKNILRGQAAGAGKN